MVKHILFIGLSCVGDVVMTTPVMLALHDRYPQARFDFITDRRSVGLYAHCPFKGELFFKHKDRLLRGVPDLLSHLWKRRYDLIVDLRTDGLAYLLRADKRFTKWDRRPYGPHAVEELMGVIAGVHGMAPVPHTQVWLSDAERAYAKKHLSVFNPPCRLLALSVGNPDMAVKTWPPKKFIELLHQLGSNFDGLIFLGAANEDENTRIVTDRLALPYINFTGNTLLQSAALLEYASLYLGPDSGLGHIASAVKTPTITLFSGKCPQRFRPWGDRAKYIRGDNNDARNIGVDAVKQLIDEALNEWVIA